MNQVQEFFEYIFNSFKIWFIVEPWETSLRVRFGKNKKVLNNGVYFRIPYFDSVYIQETRLRVCSMPLQTLTTKDGKTVTINGAIGYSITDIEKIYEKLYHPETTITNQVMSMVSEYFLSTNCFEINLSSIEIMVVKSLNEFDYGMDFSYYKTTNYAVVRTFRLIQDQSWVSEGLQMSDKK